jgi:hypothetical protein
MANKIQLSNVQVQELCSRIMVESNPDALEDLAEDLHKLLRARQEILMSCDRPSSRPIPIQ